MTAGPRADQTTQTVLFAVWTRRLLDSHQPDLSVACGLGKAWGTFATITPKVSVMSAKSRIAARLPVRRGLDECEAAVYLSLSPSFFRRLVAEGTMPRPRVVKRRRIWDIDELDLAFKALPREGGEHHSTLAPSAYDSWADYQ